uniref:Uncharacterized protein n=1 Tax=Odontella aurita TaxID=265563 RepID=A0A7S4JXY3_9STRA|mmetsp:Transcript_56688/g.169355  ORF Transcript_56688/g.169355 Transcript_56688/m.169355 type:complete len:191 (+) Transcript_56688:114-686(+)
MVASILLHRFNPTLITFGQPPTVDLGCESIPSDRYYRYINSIKEKGEDDDVAFDPVVYAPNWISKSVQYGQAILLGEDTTAVKYLGIDEQGAAFTPRFFDRQNEKAAHDIGMGKPTDYDARILSLLKNYPINITGFSNGAFCDRSYNELCVSKWCSPENKCEESAAATMPSVGSLVGAMGTILSTLVVLL